MAAQKTFLDHIKTLAIVIAIAILFPMTVHYGSTLINPKPEPLNYLGKINQLSKETLEIRIKSKQYNNQAELLQMKNRLTRIIQHNSQLQKFNQTLFYVCFSFGIAAIIVGLFLPIKEIGTGLIFGGSIALIDGYSTYWDRINNVWQFISLFTALILIIVVVTICLRRKKNSV